MLPLAVVLFSLIGESWGQCPHNVSGLNRWSEASTWAGGSKPAALDSVTIDRPVLLDESPPPLTKIYIADTGKLVVSPDDGPLLLKLRHILIHGELHIGSEDCPFTEKFRIVLTGRRNESNGQYMVPDFGEKFIGVENQGVLQIHGERKLSWTKLEGTISPPTYLLDALAEKPEGRVTSSFGLAMYIANVSDDGTPGAVSHDGFHLQDENNPNRVMRDRQRMIEALQDLQTDNIVMIAVQRGFIAEDHDALLDAIETAVFGSVTGTLQFRDNINDAYAMVFIKGDSSTLTESKNVHVERNIKYARANLQIEDIQFSAVSKLDFANKWDYNTNFLATDVDVGKPIVDLVDDATSWQTGDTVVFTSTDFDMNQAELVKIAECQRPTECSRKQIKLENELSNTHFGRILNNVDMRGEVALLTRNIVIEAELQPTCPPENENCEEADNMDTFGGHIKINFNFQSVNVEGAELHNMGQLTDIGKYPFHFHMCNETEDRAPYLRSNSIHFAFIRFITIHGTHHLRVEDNVGYETFGHGYFLEDGGEKHTVFDGNLGANTRRGGFLTTDHVTPTVFWITNPLVTFVNNVAAGTDGNGIWFVFPWEPVGPSKGLGFMAYGEAMHTPITKFENNVAHSSDSRGFNLENILVDENGNVDGEMKYFPLEDPLNNQSMPVTVNLTKYTGYRNWRHNAWARASQLIADHFSLSDSGSGLTMPSIGNRRTRHLVQNTVIVGRSESPTVSVPGMKGNWLGNRTRLVGLQIYVGNIYANGVWFSGFEKSSSYDAVGAMGWVKNTSARDVDGVMNALYDFTNTDGNRVWTWKPLEFGFNDSFHERVQTFRDLDGSVTGTPNSTIIKPYEFYVTEYCVYQPYWRMAVCPFLYARIQVTGGLFDIYRSDKPAFPERDEREFSAALRYDFYYTVQFVDNVPPVIIFTGRSISDGNGVVIGVCLPPDATFRIQSSYPVNGRSDNGVWTSVNSIQEVIDNEGAYYHNTQTRALYVRLFNNATRDVFDYDRCPGDAGDSLSCPRVRINVISSDYSITNCVEPSWQPWTGEDRELGGPYEAAGLQISTRSLPRNDRPAEWGAGSTKPFPNAVVVDGMWSDWSSWTECSVECGGGNRSRERACDSPPAANGGLECAGDRIESEDCNTAKCVPVNGKYSKWSKWSDCQCYPGAQGFKTQTKECNNPAPKYGGKYCKGTALKTASCKAKNCET